MKKLFPVMLIGAMLGCDPLAVCDGDFPELCGSEVCDTVRECCEDDVDDGRDRVCSEMSDALASVPEFLRQTARDETCSVFLESAQEKGNCLQ